MKLNVLWVAGLMLAATAGQVQAAFVTINFDDSGAVNNGAIGNAYQALGMTMSNPQWNQQNGGFGSRPPFIVIGISNTFFPKQNAPISMVFSSAVSGFSLDSINAGELGARIDACDSAVGSNLIGWDESFGTSVGANAVPLSLALGNIWRVEFYQPLAGQSEGVGFDNVSFQNSEVQEPTSIAMWGISAIGMAFARRKRQQMNLAA